jgi:hypothetical protein
LADKQKSLGHTVLGWFVVPEEDAAGEAPEAGRASRAPNAKQGIPADPAVDDLIARYASGSPPPAPPTKGASRAPAPPPPGKAGQTTQQGKQGGQGQGPVSAQAQGKSGPVSPPTPGAAAGRSAPPGPPPAPEGPIIPLGGVVGPLDFPDIFKRHGLTPEQQGHVERALMLLHNLPKETPNEVKRQIVEASLIAFGFPIDKIIESAALHVRALDHHTEKGQKETQGLLAESNQRLQELEKEAARVRQIMQEQLDGQKALSLACETQKQKVQEVLDFFGKEAVERVRASSVKLRDG